MSITGATGFIGKELSRVAREAGVEVLKLVRRPNNDEQMFAWRLGEPLPQPCEKTDVVVHLASATLNRPSAAAVESDIAGSQILIDSVRQLRRKKRVRFIFVSSQSARPGAANAYGRSKWSIEGLLGQHDEIIVRPGLVYGDQASSVSALFEKLLAFPLIPIIDGGGGIQPIHVRELCECILQIATMTAPEPMFQLGATEPMTLMEAVRSTARRKGRRCPVAIRVPIGPIRLATRLVDGLLGSRPSITERIDGLVALRPMETARSLEILGRNLAPFDRAAGTCSPTPRTGAKLSSAPDRNIV